jgi:seryl-tRNA synthetase
MIDENNTQESEGTKEFNTDDYVPKTEVEKLVQQGTEPLIRKRDQLLGEVKRAKEERNSLNEQLSQIKQHLGIDSLEDLSNLDTDKSKGNDVERKLKKYETELKSLQEERDNLNNTLSTYKTKNLNTIKEKYISDSLSELGVKPKCVPILKDFFNNKLSVVEEGDNVDVVFENDKEIVSYKDYFKKWASNPDNAEFISAPNNSGSSTQVGKGAPPSGKMSLEEIGKITDPVVAGQMLKAHGYIKK